MSTVRTTERPPVIIGAGLAGLMTALSMAPRRAIVLSAGPLGTESSSVLAQGGIAASIGADDSALLHLADTLAAGDGLCDEIVAEGIVTEAPDIISELMRLGVEFDRDDGGEIALGREAAHVRRRIVHAGGDASGRNVLQALVRSVRHTPSIEVMERTRALRLVVDDNAVTGVACDADGERLLIPTGRVVIATGGIGGLFLHSTNPLGAYGQGLALAARAGATLADLEFIQFHPTALDSTASPLRLISEAVRGEGAVLVDETGDRFMANVPNAELAPRDVVARAVWRHLSSGHRVFLDARVRGLDFARRFPAITALCREAGIDPVSQPIPIRPAVHYHMGGIAVDENGRSSVKGLWACGEAACTGLHGANRLASNSLLEAAVYGRRVARDVVEMGDSGRDVTTEASAIVANDPAPVRSILSRAAGVLRDEERLLAGIRALAPLAMSPQGGSDPAIVGLMILVSALRRRESRGAHARIDYPDKASVARRSTLRLDDAIEAAREFDLVC